jgi:hypothetical protein
MSADILIPYLADIAYWLEVGAKAIIVLLGANLILQLMKVATSDRGGF